MFSQIYKAFADSQRFNISNIFGILSVICFLLFVFLGGDAGEGKREYFNETFQVEIDSQKSSQVFSRIDAFQLTASKNFHSFRKVCKHPPYDWLLVSRSGFELSVLRYQSFWSSHSTTMLLNMKMSSTGTQHHHCHSHDQNNEKKGH